MNNRRPNSNMFAIFLALAGGFFAADAIANPLPAAPLSDTQRIDSLIRQNQILVEEIQRLRAEAERPKTKEEAFAACMQAARGQSSPMAAESIGGHCDLLLKK
jgi:hypothetical protein